MYASQIHAHGGANSKVDIYLEKAEVQDPSKPFSVVISIDTGQRRISEVRLNLAYPADKLKLARISPVNAGFFNTLLAEGKNGEIKLALSTSSPVSVENTPFGTLYFTQKKPFSLQEIKLLSNSSIIDSDSRENVIGKIMVEKTGNMPENNVILLFLNQIFSFFKSIFRIR